MDHYIRSFGFIGTLAALLAIVMTVFGFGEQALSIATGAGICLALTCCMLFVKIVNNDEASR